MIKYPDKLPLHISIKYTNNNSTPTKKFLVPKNLIIRELIFIMKQKMHLHHTQSIYFAHKDKLLNNDNLIIDVYERYNENKVLYLTVELEKFFG